MDLNPQSKQSDAIGNLYRSALFMVKGQVDLSLTFLEKAHLVLRKKIPASLVRLLTAKDSLPRKRQLFWAEKILDQYLLLKRN